MKQLEKIFNSILPKEETGKILIFDRTKILINILTNFFNKTKVIHIRNNKKFSEFSIKEEIKNVFFILHYNEKHLQKEIKFIAEQRLYCPDNFFVIRCLENDNKVNDPCYKSLISLGFKFMNDCKSNSVFYFFYKYNISNYKTIPEWLNSDNWANPQLWEK